MTGPPPPARYPRPDPGARTPARRWRRAARCAALCAALAASAGGCTPVATRPQQVWRSLIHYGYPSEPVGGPAFEAALDRYTESAARPAAVRLLQDGDETYPLMLALIRSARARILMETYIVERDRATDVFFGALADAARRGVEVRFLADAAGFRRGTLAHLRELTAQGVHARVFNPLFLSWTVLRANNRDHRKILVVDGAHAVLGGLNLSDKQLGDGVAGWRDTAVLVSGPAAADAERVFAQTWNQAGRDFLGRDLPVVGLGRVKRGLDEPFLRLRESTVGRRRFTPPPPDPAAPPAPFDRLPPPSAPSATAPAAGAEAGDPAAADDGGPLDALVAQVGGRMYPYPFAENDGADGAPPPWPAPAPYDYHGRAATARIVASSPDQWNCPTYDLAILGAWGARERLDIACAYFVPPAGLKRALAAAARRGVRVRLLLPGVTDVKWVREIGMRHYGALLRAGVRIYEWPHPILHAKTMAVDGKWTVVGSANMDGRSYFLDYEVMAAVTDGGVAEAAHRRFEADLGRAREMSLADWRRRGLRQRITEWIFTPLAGQY